MGYEFSNERPIYIQIIEHIKEKIISGKYLPNQKIPSVRELSFEFEVNPNTVQKALFELEEMGLIYTERTNGKFVTNNIAVVKKTTEEMISLKVDEFFNCMSKMGLNREDVLKIINDRR